MALCYPETPRARAALDPPPTIIGLGFLARLGALRDGQTGFCVRTTEYDDVVISIIVLYVITSAAAAAV